MVISGKDLQGRHTHETQEVCTVATCRSQREKSGNCRKFLVKRMSQKKKQCLECCNSLKQSPPQTEKQNSSTFCCPKTEKKSTMFSVIKDFLETVAI